MYLYSLEAAYIISFQKIQLYYKRIKNVRSVIHQTVQRVI